MRFMLTILTAVLLAGAVPASAEVSGHEDRFMKDMKETVYATDQHMVFSIRSSLIRWLGGMPVADEADLRAARREKWWGKDVPVLTADTVGPRDQ